MVADASTLFERAAATYYSCDENGRENLEAWSRKNRATLMAADGLAKQALKVADPNPDLLAFLAKVNFDLLQMDAAEKYAKQAIQLSSITFDANYVLYLIELNNYIGLSSAQANSPLGGAAGFGYKLGFGAVKYARLPNAKKRLEDSVHALKDAFVGSTRHERATYNGVLYMASALIEAYETLGEFRISGRELLQAIVDELGALGPSKEEELQAAVERVIAISYSLLNT